MDHATGRIDIYNQVSLGASDTIMSKELYEAKALGFGITDRCYRGDNGVYRSKSFMDNLYKRKQHMSVYGAGAHGQDDVSEQSIQTTFNFTQIMMLHQALL